jgi:hypothetical protein
MRVEKRIFRVKWTAQGTFHVLSYARMPDPLSLLGGGARDLFENLKIDKVCDKYRNISFIIINLTQCKRKNKLKKLINHITYKYIYYWTKKIVQISFLINIQHLLYLLFWITYINLLVEWLIYIIMWIWNINEELVKM